MSNKVRPPRLANVILRWYCSDAMIEDLFAQYMRHVEPESPDPEPGQTTGEPSTVSKEQTDE